MRTHTLLTRTASIAACIGILCSSSAPAFGAGKTRVVRDVELAEDGILRGQVYDTEGAALAGADVELRFKGTAIARTKTSAQGDFAVSGARGGAHELAVADHATPVRLWKSGTGPDGATNGVVLSSGNTVRGQGFDQFGNPVGATSGLGLIDVVTLSSLALGGVGVYYGVENNNELKDLQDQVKELASP